MRRRIFGSSEGLEWGVLDFERAALADTHFPYFEARSGKSGPRLAVIAGMHPNEVSSMEAALRFGRAAAAGVERGSVSILPTLNMPGLYLHSDTICPVDGKNINFSFPGDPAGTFSEVLADALITEWAADADLVVDLHGGDLREDVAKFVMCQLTGDDAFDAVTRRFARCFDADLIVEFPIDETDNTGRATNALPKLRRSAVMAEAGANGRIDEESVSFHLDGLFELGRELGLFAGPKKPKGRRNVTLDGYRKIHSPAAGRFYRRVSVNDFVVEGQVVATLADLYGAPIAEMRAPLSGHVVMAVTHAIVEAGDMVFGIGEVAVRPAE